MTRHLRFAYFLLGLGIIAALALTGVSYTNTIHTISHAHQTTVSQLIALQHEVRHLLQEVASLKKP